MERDGETEGRAPEGGREGVGSRTQMGGQKEKEETRRKEREGGGTHIERWRMRKEEQTRVNEREERRYGHRRMEKGQVKEQRQKQGGRTRGSRTQKDGEREGVRTDTRGQREGGRGAGKARSPDLVRYMFKVLLLYPRPGGRRLGEERLRQRGRERRRKRRKRREESKGGERRRNNKQR